MWMPKSKLFYLLFGATLSGLASHFVLAVPGVDEMRRGFLTPPEEAKPRVWWHWMNGNVSEQGITLDLEWMHRIGIGGAQSFDAAFETPQVVDSRLVFMTPPWREAFFSAAAAADRLGLELAIAGSPGWSESGGPWVTAGDGMKKLVWAETRVNGGSRVSGILMQPPSTVGPFQDVPVDWRFNSYAGRRPSEAVPQFYKDIAILAYRLPDEEQSMAELHPLVTTSAGPMDADILWDGDYTRAVTLPVAPSGQAAWIQVDLGRPRHIYSMSLGLQDFFNGNGFAPHYIGATLEASIDGAEFRPVADAYDTADQTPQGIAPIQETITFEPVLARYYRLVLQAPPAMQMPPALATYFAAVPKEHKVTEFVLHTSPRVNHFEQKAAYFLDSGLSEHATPHVMKNSAIRLDQIVDLTSRLQSNGELDWSPPDGRWAVLRVGYSLLGVTNHPASPEGTGLEVDKLSRNAVKTHMDSYLSRYESILGHRLMGKHGLRAMVNDSYEAGAQNWTDNLPLEFARRRGYDLHRWLPALTGRIVDSAEATDHFLWDFRRTLAELLTENHYGQISASLHARGMIHYGESHELCRAFIGDGMDVKRDDDIPMGAMWVPGFFITQEQGDADLRESASVAHFYGQNRAAAESMTALGIAGVAYSFAPESLKPTADRELADGINLLVIHTSAHQPVVNGSPGVTLGPFGQWFTRNETWAEQATPWVTYLARSSYLLQQGHFVADIAYYYGQDSNITALYAHHLAPVPEGYAFDFASAHALTLLSVRNGDMVTQGGMRYRVLALAPRARSMSLDVLRTIEHLVRTGATVVGEKPHESPSLADNAAEFRVLADAVWGTVPLREHQYGMGRVYSGVSLAEALASINLEPDFKYIKPADGDATVWFVHRRLVDGDLYFVNNREDRTVQIEARFRVAGRAPEIWHADTGVIEPASYRQTGEITAVPLELASHDALFVVFRRLAQGRQRTIPQPVRQTVFNVPGPWEVHFQRERGAPERATFTELKPWDRSSDPGIRYFSGTASYETVVNVPASWIMRGARLELDLGAVKELAEVMVGGHSAGIAWKQPYSVDVTDLLKVGKNSLEIRVTNLWPNRLIGDKQPGDTMQVTRTTFNPYGADSQLFSSGLLGPVTIRRVMSQK
jgi:(4-O-methyl)-D-glucuronate---lignin esterase